MMSDKERIKEYNKLKLHEPIKMEVIGHRELTEEEKKIAEMMKKQVLEQWQKK